MSYETAQQLENILNLLVIILSILAVMCLFVIFWLVATRAMRYAYLPSVLMLVFVLGLGALSLYGYSVVQPVIDHHHHQLLKQYQSQVETLKAKRLTAIRNHEDQNKVDALNQAIAKAQIKADHQESIVNDAYMSDR